MFNVFSTLLPIYRSFLVMEADKVSVRSPEIFFPGKIVQNT